MHQYRSIITRLQTEMQSVSSAPLEEGRAQRIIEVNEKPVLGAIVEKNIVTKGKKK